MNAEWFGPRLKELRGEKGWTQQQLAERAGLAVGVVRKLEQRENKPTWETALALASALGVSCEAFVQAPAERPPAGPGRPPKPAAPAPPPAEDLQRQAKLEPAEKVPQRTRGKPPRRTGGRG